MADIINFPYRHKEGLTLNSIHEMIDDFPSDDEISSCMIIITTKGGNIMTCYDGRERTNIIGALEYLKHNILNNMD